MGSTTTRTDQCAIGALQDGLNQQNAPGSYHREVHMTSKDDRSLPPTTFTTLLYIQRGPFSVL